MQAQENQVALPLRSHTILGVCEALGEDFGFNPIFLRVPLAASVIWNPLIAFGTYFVLGLIVFASRLARACLGRLRARAAVPGQADVSRRAFAEHAGRCRDRSEPGGRAPCARNVGDVGARGMRLGRRHCAGVRLVACAPPPRPRRRASRNRSAGAVASRRSLGRRDRRECDRELGRRSRSNASEAWASQSRTAPFGQR